ncbi:hypothetical protein BS47DRAFT_1366742 [Hydnum rufescens UP504]|uniref:Uncharacterized protein n=1 Tax=Hydnum rufescens UP504 TaxID=1448309 RepID=A0A9P6DQD9_9AGAM|nr:hypothetical protein BS47DRAFT_1366742 [Hydnum rufescens UP504]
MCSSDEDNDAVQDALDEFSNGHFNEPEDSDADLKLLHEAKTPLPSSPTPTHTTRLLKGNAQKSEILDKSAARLDLDSVEPSSGTAVLTGTKLFAALLTRKLELIKQKRAKYAGDAQSYRDWKAGQSAIHKGKGKEGEITQPTHRRVITKKDKAVIKEKMESHNAEWTEMANELGIELEDVLQYVYQCLYGAENPGHGNSLFSYYRKLLKHSNSGLLIYLEIIDNYWNQIYIISGMGLLGGSISGIGQIHIGGIGQIHIGGIGQIHIGVSGGSLARSGCPSGHQGSYIHYIHSLSIQNIELGMKYIQNFFAHPAESLGPAVRT